MQLSHYYKQTRVEPGAALQTPPSLINALKVSSSKKQFIIPVTELNKKNYEDHF